MAYNDFLFGPLGNSINGESINSAIREWLGDAVNGESAAKLGDSMSKAGLGLFGDAYSGALEDYAEKYIKAMGLDKFDNQGNPVLDAKLSDAVKYRDEDHLNAFYDSWQNIVGSHELQKQDQIEYYANYVDSLKNAGLNPIMATTGGSLPTISSANASMSNINAYEFLTREQNKMNIQYLKSITDIVKRLIPDHRKTNNASKIDANTILKIVK